MMTVSIGPLRQRGLLTLPWRVTSSQSSTSTALSTSGIEILISGLLRCSSSCACLVSSRASRDWRKQAYAFDTLASALLPSQVCATRRAATWRHAALASAPRRLCLLLCLALCGIASTLRIHEHLLLLDVLLVPLQETLLGHPFVPAGVAVSRRQCSKRATTAWGARTCSSSPCSAQSTALQARPSLTLVAQTQTCSSGPALARTGMLRSSVVWREHPSVARLGRTFASYMSGPWKHSAFSFSTNAILPAAGLQECTPTRGDAFVGVSALGTAQASSGGASCRELRYTG